MNENDYGLNKGVRDGGLVKGRVVRKENGEVYLDIGFKSEGFIPVEETAKYTYYDDLKEGDELDVYVKRVEGKEGMVQLSKIIADKKIIFGNIKKAFEAKTSMDGLVTKAVKGGYIIDFGANITAFLPMSHAKAYGVTEDLTNRKIFVKIIQLDEEKRNIVVSYKEHMAEKQKADEENLKKNFPINEKIEVAIVGVSEVGLEVEKDGIKAFVIAGEIAWTKITDMAGQYKIGDILQVLVMQGETGRIMLSAKRLTENPFKKFLGDIKPGDTLKGVIKETVPQGALVEFTGGVEGFLPASEITYYRRIKDPGEVLKKGQEISPLIFKIDAENEKILVSLKRLERNPWDDIDERYPQGARVAGIIKEIKEGVGAEVELEENVDAFVAMSNISWQTFGAISEVLKQGEKKEFRIMEADKQKFKIMLGLKQLHTEPWETFVEKYKEGGFVDVKIMDIEETAIVCQIIDGVNGRILIRNKAKVINNKGEIIKARISKIDKDHKKVILSSQEFEVSEEKKEINEYIKTHEHKFTLSDVIQIKKTDKPE